MKWGKHKGKTNNASPTAMSTHTPFVKNPNQAPPRVKGATDIRPKHLNRMSDVELRNRLNRIQMETQYKQLTEGKSAPDKSKAKVAYENFEKGHTVVKQLMAVAKTAQAIHKFANSDMVKEIAKLIKDTK
jgi:beta-xylosidase